MHYFQDFHSIHWLPRKVHGYCQVLSSLSMLALDLNAHLEANTVQIFCSAIDTNPLKHCMNEVIRNVCCFYGTSLFTQRPFSVIRQVFSRHLLNCSKLLHLSLPLLASVIIHHQEQYMPLTWCLSGTPAEMVRSSFISMLNCLCLWTFSEVYFF